MLTSSCFPWEKVSGQVLDIRYFLQGGYPRNEGTRAPSRYETLYPLDILEKPAQPWGGCPPGSVWQDTARLAP